MSAIRSETVVETRGIEDRARAAVDFFKQALERPCPTAIDPVAAVRIAQWVCDGKARPISEGLMRERMEALERAAKEGRDWGLAFPFMSDPKEAPASDLAGLAARESSK